MGAVVCFQCISHNSNVDDNYGHLNVDINNQEPNSDQYMNIETKVGTFGPAGTLKNKKTLKIDKGDFVRLKADNIFEEYDLKEKLGEGAYGCVYKVIQRKTNYLRAVKAIKKKMVDKNEFMNEIEVLKTVDHPNIIIISSKSFT